MTALSKHAYRTEIVDFATYINFHVPSYTSPCLVIKSDIEQGLCSQGEGEVQGRS